MPEISPALANHEIDRGAETAFGIQSGNRFLQDKICSHLEGLLRGRAAVQDGKGDGVLVAGALTQAFEHTQGALQVITIYNDGVELFAAQDFLAGTDTAADFNIDGKPVQVC